MKEVRAITLRFLFCLLALFFMGATAAGQGDERLNRIIHLKEMKGTRYQLLRQVSELTGYLFVYDSRVVNNDETTRIRKGEYTVKEAVCSIAGNKNLQLSFLGNHLLLSLPEVPKAPVQTLITIPEPSYFTIEGMVYDRYSKEPLSSATISVKQAGIGTVTNLEGRFRITLNDSLREASIHVSHLGYENVELSAAMAAGKYLDVELEPQVIPLQEVVVRAVNPLQTVEKMVQLREQNYASTPYNTTAFYREGVEHKKRNVDLTEGVLRIYKVGYQRAAADQVKLIKMRRTVDVQEEDTILTKVKSGIHATLLLDLVKNLPDFLTMELPNPYNYMHTDITVIDGRVVNVISFEQKKDEKEPYYKGQLYIDTENYALVEARFEINPEYVEKATYMYVEKQSKEYKLTLQRAAYVVSYKPSPDGIYQINHVRGDLEFRIKRKRKWFGSDLKVWFELVNCKTEPANGQGIPRNERIPQRTIFSEVKHAYDANFWGHFNVIPPEDKLKELILQNLSETAGE